MTSLLDQNREAHFFCDEMPIGKDGLRQAFLIDFSEKMSPKKYLWISWNNNSTPTDELKTSKYSLKMLLCISTDQNDRAEVNLLDYSFWDGIFGKRCL